MPFSKVCSLKSNNCSTVTLYRSNLSGMRVAFVKQQSPIVNAWFSFATKTITDDGLPHTLEHLIFMGSHKYPYKGFLDVIANRCFASGTNGYTEDDHTAYSITTVGSEGFLKALPVYLDHLFFPLLTPEQFMTEVHHITKDGRNNGVIYAEMQDHENDINNIMDLTLRKLTYPEEHPYRSISGGRLSQLRDECTLENVVDFHKKHYTNSNMILTIVGNIEEDAVIKILEGFELFGYSRPLSSKRPFDDIWVPETHTHQIEHVECPVEDENVGVVSITWQGPLHHEDDCYSLPLLLTYFCDGTDSPLQQRYVQHSDPICSTINPGYRQRKWLEFSLRFGGVYNKYLDDEDLFSTTPLEILTSTEIDIERMKVIIEQEIHQMAVLFEGSSSIYYHGLLSIYAMYAPNVNATSDNIPYLEKQLNEVDNTRALLKYSKDYWEGLAKKYFTPDYIVIFCHPNKALGEKLAKKEEKRIKDQREKLGQKGLKECGAKLKKAFSFNERSVPKEINLRNFHVNAIQSIKFIEIKRRLYFENSGTHYPTICHQLNTNFLFATILFDLHNIPSEHRSLILLLTKLFTSCNSEIDGKMVRYEKLSQRLSKDFIAYKIDIGVKNEFDDYLVFNFVLLPEKSKNITKWIKIFLKCMIYENSRIGVCARNIAASISEKLQEGDIVAPSLMTSMIAPKGSTKFYNCMVASGNFHYKLADYVSDERNNGRIVKLVQSLVKMICNSPANVHFIGNKKALKSALTTDWSFITNSANTRMVLKDISQYFLDYHTNMGRTFCVCFGGTQSSFLIQRSRSNFKYMDTRLVYAKLLAQYFTQCEGPFWNYIRGKGYCYGVYIFVSNNTGLGFYLYRASDIIQAYDDSKKLALNVLKTRKIDHEKFEAAKRSLISQLVQTVSHVKKVGKFSIVEHLRGLKPEDNTVKYEVKIIWEAKPEDVFDAVDQDFIDLFDDERCIRSVVVYKPNLKNVLNYFPNVEIKSIDGFDHSGLSFDDDKEPKEE